MFCIMKYINYVSHWLLAAIIINFSKLKLWISLFADRDRSDARSYNLLVYYLILCYPYKIGYYSLWFEKGHTAMFTIFACNSHKRNHLFTKKVRQLASTHGITSLLTCPIIKEQLALYYNVNICWRVHQLMGISCE